MRRSNRGMTLIEVLIAVAILSLLVSSIAINLRTTTTGMKEVGHVQEHYAIIRNGMARMTSDLSMAYLSFNRPLNDPKNYTLFEGKDSFDADTLAFSSFSHVRIRKDANESDQAVIQYFVQDDPEDRSRSHLYRRETKRLTGEKPEDLEEFYPAYVAIENVVGLDLKYWDSRQEEWLDEWDTTKTDMQPDRLPERVWIALKVLSPGSDEPQEFHAQVALMMQERVDLSK